MYGFHRSDAARHDGRHAGGPRASLPGLPNPGDGTAVAEMPELVLVRSDGGFLAGLAPPIHRVRLHAWIVVLGWRERFDEAVRRAWGEGKTGGGG